LDGCGEDEALACTVAGGAGPLLEGVHAGAGFDHGAFGAEEGDPFGPGALAVEVDEEVAAGDAGDAEARAEHFIPGVDFEDAELEDFDEVDVAGEGVHVDGGGLGARKKWA